MDNYICKRGNKEDLLKRWNYLVDIHPGNNSWIVFRENNIRNFDNNYIIPYYGILNDKVICEITAYIRPEAFIGDIDNPEGLYSDTMAYLAAFRTDKEFEGKGYFSTLYKYVEEDLKRMGYTEFSLGVGPEAVRNIEIYFHLGYRDYIKTTIEHDPPKNEFDIPEDEYCNFYKKHL